MYWLIIIVGVAGTPMHVGNFKNLESCKSAWTTKSDLFNPSKEDARVPTYLCIPASEEGTSPPPG
jgi:hypothetical protein